MPILHTLERRIEAILFASGDPIETEKIAEALSIERKMVQHLIQGIRDRYLEQQSPFEILTLGSCYQMCTLPAYAKDIRTALTLRRGAALSSAALEVLAVIAYNQPVTRSFAEQVRGVDCSSIVRSLLEKGLIEEDGRLNIPGRPIAYRTTANFLRTFGLESLDQLPSVPDLPAAPPSADDDPAEQQIDLFTYEEQLP